MPSINQLKGDLGESLARAYLEKKGYRFLTQGWQCRYGEIDLIMEDKDELVFCEVKLRSAVEYGYPEDMVTAHKRRSLRQTANNYRLKNNRDEAFFRFDIIAIIDQGGDYEISHFVDTIRIDS